MQLRDETHIVRYDNDIFICFLSCIFFSRSAENYTAAFCIKSCPFGPIACRSLERTWPDRPRTYDICTRSRTGKPGWRTERKETDARSAAPNLCISRDWFLLEVGCASPVLSDPGRRFLVLICLRCAPICIHAVCNPVQPLLRVCLWGCG